MAVRMCVVVVWEREKRDGVSRRRSPKRMLAAWTRQPVLENTCCVHNFLPHGYANTAKHMPNVATQGHQATKQPGGT